MGNDVFAALEAQTDRLDEILGALDADQWSTPSLCPGWSVSDVVLHLAQTEEGVVATIEATGPQIPIEGASNIDEAMEQWVRAERGADPSDVHVRWNDARKRALDALRSADPDTPLTWAAAPLRPKTLATTRLSEHWIHTMDIAEPLGVDNPDTEDLEHIAWLALRSIPYAFSRAGAGDPPTVRADLTSPSGEAWTFGSDDAECVITGSMGELCRIAARRVPADQAREVRASGPRSQEVLDLIRTYA